MLIVKRVQDSTEKAGSAFLGHNGQEIALKREGRERRVVMRP
jgi:hypothetical protein